MPRVQSLNPLALLAAGTFFMELLDGTVITTALPQMAQSFGAAPVDLHIGITAYLLTVAVFILPGGWAADRFGARPVFTAAIATFTLGSALCGIATSVETFVAARILQGLGGAMMVPVGRLVVLRTTPKPQLMQAIATLTWPGLTAPLIGPPLGGFIAGHFHWRYIFLINIPLGLLAILLALRMIPDIARTARTEFDTWGFAAAAAACLCATMALDLLGEPRPNLPLIAALAAGAALSGTLLLRHLRRHPAPLLSPAPLQVPTFRMTVLAGTLMRTVISAMPFLLPLLFQLGFGFDPFHAGLLVLALFAGNLGMKPMTSWVLRRWGFRTVLLGNSLIQALTMLGCALLGPFTPLPLILLLLAVSGASRSMQFTAIGTLAFADVPQPVMAPANTWFSVGFQLANGMGVAVGALALRLADLGTGAGTTLPAFHWAFVTLAVLMTACGVLSLTLARNAGALVSGHTPRL